MQNKRFFFLLFLATAAFAQTGGYWDKERAITKELTVGAGDRILASTEELPLGTTELVYRITLLDENQQMAGSLVSLLKAIPDPSGVSQGSAGAVFLLSKISGDDKCKYAIFSDKDNAIAYKSDGKTDKACLYQDNPVNKEAKRLSVNKSTCFKSGVLWFGFESKNWIMKQRIVLEVVPWVDSKLSTGWNVENRKSVLNLCKTTDLAKKLGDADEYCVCVQSKIQNQYRFKEYEELLAAEKTKAFRDAGRACYNETDAATAIYAKLRLDAAQLTAKAKYADAIAKLQTIFNENKANAADYSALGMNYLFTRQFDKAQYLLREGEKQYPSDLLIQLNLAHALLLRGNYSQAKGIYKKYKTQNATDNLSWQAKVIADFAAFKKAGLSSEDFDRILKTVE